MNSNFDIEKPFEQTFKMSSKRLLNLGSVGATKVYIWLQDYNEKFILNK